MELPKYFIEPHLEQRDNLFYERQNRKPIAYSTEGGTGNQQPILQKVEQANSLFYGRLSKL